MQHQQSNNQVPTKHQQSNNQVSTKYQQSNNEVSTKQKMSVGGYSVSWYVEYIDMCTFVYRWGLQLCAYEDVE